MPGKPTRSLAKASVLAACIAFAIPAAAHGEPSASAQVGEAFSYTGVVYDNIDPNRPLLIVDPDHDKCGGLTTGVHWGDFGALTPVPYPAQSSLVSVPGGWNAVVSASYTYKAPKSTGGASVDLSVTCDGVVSGDIYLPWVNIVVTGSSPGGSGPGTNPPTGPGTDPPTSCAFPGTPTAAVERFGEVPGHAAQGAGPCKQRLTTVEKAALRTASRTLLDFSRVDFALSIVGFAVPVPGSHPVTGLFLATSVLKLRASDYAGNLAADPPDPRYRSLPRLRKVHPGQIRPRGRLTKARAIQVNRYLAALARSVSLHEAVLTGVERAQGATIGGSRTWEKRQMLTAASRADALAKLLNALPRRSKSAAKALKGAGLSRTVTRKRAAEVQRRVAEGNVPTSFRRLFFKLVDQSGPDGPVAAEEFLRDFVATSPSELTGRFPQTLIAPKVLRSYRNEAKAMHSFARQARAKPLASH
jgi:hypothetical protein